MGKGWSSVGGRSRAWVWGSGMAYHALNAVSKSHRRCTSQYCKRKVCNVWARMHGSCGGSSDSRSSTTRIVGAGSTLIKDAFKEMKCARPLDSLPLSTPCLLSFVVVKLTPPQSHHRHA